MMCCVTAVACAPIAAGRTEQNCEPSGFAAMHADGTLVLRLGRQLDTLLSYPPSHPEYADWVAWAGHPAAGEERPVPSYEGMAVMDMQGVLTITRGGGDAGGLLIEPSRNVISPVEPGYKEEVRRLGGLEPGHFKGVLRQCRN